MATTHTLSVLVEDKPGVLTRVADQAPEYPMFLFLGVFDFPDRPGPANHVPRLRVTRVSHRPLAP